MTGGFQLPTAAPHKDGCRTAVQTGKVTTTEICTAGTMSTVSVSKTVEHNRIHRIDYMTKYLKGIKHCRQLQLTWPHSSPLILIQYLLHWYFISVKHKALKISSLTIIKAVSLISVQDLQEQVLVLQSAGVLGLGRFTVDDPLPALLSE